MSSRLLQSLKTVPRHCGGRRLVQSRALAFQVSNPEEQAKMLQKPAQDPSSPYISPPLIHEVFSSAYDVLKEESANVYEKLAQNPDLSEAEAEELKIQAEKYNPEVNYNFRFNRAKVDASQPVYRHLMQQEWEQHDLMVTMQRLEQLHVIPDTMATLEPRVDVQVQFAHNTQSEFCGYLQPGVRMPAFAVARPPTIKVQEFRSQPFSGLYSVVIVNPDVADLQRNSFKTELNYGLYNVPLTFAENIISPAQLQHTPERVFHQYQPLVPEKNAPTQRACVWVFRQERELSGLEFDASNFDIRAFAEEHGLDAVGAHVWRQDFDRSTNAVRKEYGLKKGNVYAPTRGTKPLV